LAKVEKKGVVGSQHKIYSDYNAFGETQWQLKKHCFLSPIAADAVG